MPLIHTDDVGNEILDVSLAGKLGRVEWSLLVFLAGLTAWVAAAAFLRRPFVGDFVDDGQYLVSARSLCDLEGYRLPSRPGSPVATKYPIGAPAIAAVTMALLPGEATAGHDWLAGKIVVISAGVILAAAARQFLILSGLSRLTASLLALAVVWHPSMTHLTATLMSDVPYAAVSTVLLVRWTRRARCDDVTTLGWAVDGLLAGAGWLIRGNGITLVVAAVAAAFLRRSNRFGAMAAVMAAVACMWVPATVHVRAMSGPRDTGNYATELKAAYRNADHPWSLPVANVARIPGVLVAAIASPTSWTSPVSSAMSRWAALRWMVSVIALALLVLGVSRLIGFDAWPLSVWMHACLTILVFALWHVPLDNRFALPLFPMVLAACALGVEAATSRRLGAVGFATLTMTSSLLVVVGIVLRSIPHGGVMGRDRDSSTMASFDAIRAYTKRDAVILCPVPELVYLNTGRVAAPLRDDAAGFTGRPPTWESLRDWLRLADGHPIYLLDTQSPFSASGSGIQTLLGDGRVGLEPIAAGLWRVERREDPSFDAPLP